MCLVFLAFQVNADYPIMLGANREESRRRPSTSPVCCVSGSLHALLAGADHGPDGTFPRLGTWLGVNEAGLVVAVTNRRDGTLPWEQQTRSRGLLAVDLLQFVDPEQAASHAQSELAGGGFGGCDYLLAKGQAAFAVEAPGVHRIAVRSLPAGVHAVTNLDFDDRDDPRVSFVHENLDATQFLSSARQICREERIVVNGPERGTVSSSLLMTGSETQFYHLIGNPAQHEYERFTPFCSVHEARSS